MFTRRFILLLAASLSITAASHAQSWDALADFSKTNNPNGPWSYGWSNTLTSPITLYTEQVYIQPNFFFWEDPNIGQLNDPQVGINYGAKWEYFPANSLLEHPGPNNQFTHCVWTAPAAGVYNIKATFTAIWTGGPHGYLLKNGVDIGDAALTEDVPQNYTFNSVTLAAGDTIDAALGVGPDGVFYDDETMVSLTITSGISSGGGGTTGAYVPGVYAGLVSGTSGQVLADGYLRARIGKKGNFTAQLRFAGSNIPVSGTFTSAGTYTGIVTLKNGSQVTVSLAFDQNGNLTGTVTENGVTSNFAGASVLASDTSAVGTYAFTIAPGSISTGPAPYGDGFGTMSVKPNGAVYLTGELADGKIFTASSLLVSGSIVPIYADPYNDPASGLAGTITFRDTSNVSDCDGVLYWSVSPSTNPARHYPAGFALSTQFLGDSTASSVTGLNHDSVTFTAAGADLPVDIDAQITLASQPPAYFIYNGNDNNIHLTVYPGTDVFFGDILDGATSTWRPFAGTLMPKSRSGAGLFLSNGLSGAVSIQY